MLAGCPFVSQLRGKMYHLCLSMALVGVLEVILQDFRKVKRIGDLLASSDMIMATFALLTCHQKPKIYKA